MVPVNPLTLVNVIGDTSIAPWWTTRSLVAMDMLKSGPMTACNAKPRGTPLVVAASPVICTAYWCSGIEELMVTANWKEPAADGVIETFFVEVFTKGIWGTGG